MKVLFGARSGFWLLALALLVGVLLLVVFLHDWVADVLVVRGAYTVWLMTLLLRSRPQMAYWVLPVICGIGIGILVLVGNLRQRGQFSPPQVVLGRASEWDGWLDRASNQPFFKKYLRRKLENLTREILQLEQRMPEVLRTLDPGRLVSSSSQPPLPPEVQALFAVHLPQSSADGEGAVGPWNPEVVIDYLESIWEGTDDR